MIVESRLLVIVGGLVAAGGAQAADMPANAKPAQHVKICTLHGDGYYYVPGGDTCIKLGGYVRAGYGWNVASARTPAYFGAQGAQDRTVAAYSTRHRANVQMDTRTETEYGTLRTLTSVHFQNEESASSFNVSSALIQWAGFTFGRGRSSQDTWGISDSWHYAQQQNNSDTGINGVNQIAYAWELGDGMTLGVGADAARRKSLANLSDLSTIRVGAEPASYFAGQRWPDVHVDFKVNQAWGYWATSLVAHDVAARSYQCQSSTTLAGSCGHPKDRVGWAIQSGAELKMDFITQGDRLGFGARYAVGASGFGGGSSLASPGLFGSGNTVAVGWITDGVFTGFSGGAAGCPGAASPANGTASTVCNASQIQLTTSWTVMAAYEHYWTPDLKTSFYGGYTSIEHNATAKSFFANNVCRSFAAGAGQAGFSGGSLATNCNPDWRFFQGGVRTQWTPAPGLTVGMDALYTHVWTAFNGTQAALAGVSTSSLTQLNPVIGARQAGTYNINNQGIWSVVLRVQRNFNTGGGSLRRSQ